MAEVVREEMVQSYHRVRMALGLLGMALPMVLLVEGLFDAQRIQPSISDSYHTVYRDIFVGTLFAIGVFMLVYRGHPKQKDWISDDWLATVAGLAAFGVALFPNEVADQQIASVTQNIFGIGLSHWLHYLSALVFFSCLGGFCTFKFRRTNRTGRKPVYLWCGVMIWTMLVVILIASIVKVNMIEPYASIVINNKIVFWAEAFGIWAFGLAWLTKGLFDIKLVRKLSAIKIKTEEIAS